MQHYQLLSTCVPNCLFVPQISFKETYDFILDLSNDNAWNKQADYTNISQWFLVINIDYINFNNIK